MDVTLPDGTTVKGVPDGTTKSQLAQKLKANGHDVPESWLSGESNRESDAGGRDVDKYGIPFQKGSTPESREVTSDHPEGVGEKLYGAGEAALNTGLSAILSPVASVADIAGHEMHKGSQYGDWVMSHALPPTTQAGKRYSGNIGNAMNDSGLGALPGLSEMNTIGHMAPPAIGQAARGVGNAASGVTRVPGAISGALREAAEGQMTSALKPSQKASKVGDAQAAIDTMLNDNIPLSKKGVAKLHEKIDDLDEKISDVIKNSTGKVKIKDIEPIIKQKLDDLKKQVNPNADIKAVKDAWEEFKKSPLIAQKNEIPVQIAQEIKQGTYQQLKKKYGQMSNASDEAQKAIAKGLREGIEANAPEATKFTKEQQRLIRTLKVVEQRVLLDANKNPMGLSLLAKNPLQWALFMADRSGPFKVMIARILNSGSNMLGGTAKVAGPKVAPPTLPKPPSSTAAPMAPPPVSRLQAVRIEEAYRKKWLQDHPNATAAEKAALYSRPDTGPKS